MCFVLYATNVRKIAEQYKSAVFHHLAKAGWYTKPRQGQQPETPRPQ